MYYFFMGSVLLPIAPESLSTKYKNTNKTLTLINEGEINILREAGLTEFDFKVLIPAVEYTFAKYTDGFKAPSYFLDHFEKLKTSKQPFQFIVSRELPNGKLVFYTDIKVALEDYTVDEKAKEGFDLLVSINLKQYKSYGTKIVKVIEKPKTDTTNTGKGNTGDGGSGKGETEVTVTETRSLPPILTSGGYTYYKVEKDILLMDVVMLKYGNNVTNAREVADEIVKLNEGKITPDLWVVAGTTLTLPPRDKYVNKPQSTLLKSKYNTSLDWLTLG